MTSQAGMRPVRRIIVHCSLTRPDQDIGAEEITRWHVNENGWSDIGYHYVIRRDGTLEAGRPLSREGAHCKGNNDDSIGICLVGGRKLYLATKESMHEFNYNIEQLSTLQSIIKILNDTFGPLRVSGDRDWHPDKWCPGFDVRAWWYSGGPIE